MAEKIEMTDNCDCSVIHKNVVKLVKGKMTAEENLYDLAELFKIFGDSTRIRILSALNYSEMCVCDIAFLLKMSKSAISHQLRILKQVELVKCRKNGKIVFYSLKDSHVKQILYIGLTHINEI